MSKPDCPWCGVELEGAGNVVPENEVGKSFYCPGSCGVKYVGRKSQNADPEIVTFHQNDDETICWDVDGDDCDCDVDAEDVL